ncbi:phosphoadenylyl-sulfate reductase [Salinispira pacifica]|uniref:Phosphoadenosine 5'-phosphosulfate reductase n=1 Tax=Salinispira pacifica TaxID=1307761 RepID=V5WIA1_9SPIO|nr:phosphoadenylyl-sulfate reductase [Salinispira pacifica]AHC15360.1 Phosphoadenylyl-sulfate reductase (thioredoxin) [Salinispira pacifica]
MRDSSNPPDPLELIRWAHNTFSDKLIMTTSFGIYSAVMLHLATRVVPDIPVVWIDTGYLPPETYLFAEELRKRLSLNLHVYQSELSPARMETLYGKLHESRDPEDLDTYDYIRKVRPMTRALDALGGEAWIAGLRSEQTGARKQLKPVDKQNGTVKIHPILHWTRTDLLSYLDAHSLSAHPLHQEGYESVGDAHSSRPMTAQDQHPRETRFHGVKQECGLHLDLDQGQNRAFNSSRL